MPNEDPFEYYGQRNGQPSVTAESIGAAVDDARTHGAQLEQLGKDLKRDSKIVDINVQGELVAPLKNAPAEVAAAATDLGLKAAYAAAAMERFASQVETFDQGVTKLNNKVEVLIQLYKRPPLGPYLPGEPAPKGLSHAEAHQKATAELSGKYKAL